MKLTSVVYHSSATIHFAEPDLISLLEECRENNVRLGVTGLLLFKSPDFMQVIEGEERTIEELTARIEKDPRHHSYTELRWEIIQERRYGNWSMGFRNLENVDLLEIPGYSPFMNEPLTSPLFKTDTTRAQKLLMLFRDKG